MTTIADVTTELGPARVFVDAPAHPRALVLLGHGAGGGVDAPDLVALAEGLPERGIAVLRFEQPWRTAGKKVAPAPARLDVGWRAATAYANDMYPRLPLLVGGRSAGARVACRYAAAAPVTGVIALSFPLHPPGRPESSRADELLAAGPKILVFQGAKDPFGTPQELAAVIGDRNGFELIPVPDVGHEMKPPKRAQTTPADLGALLLGEVTRFVGEPGRE